MRVLLAAAALAVGLLASGGAAAARVVVVGVELPRSGVDAGDGIRLRDAVELAAVELRGRGLRVELRPAGGPAPVRNPHQDEGSDNGADVDEAPAAVRGLAHAAVRVVVGPLRSNVAVAELGALSSYGLAAISPTATAPSRPNQPIFHIAASDRQLVAAAYRRIVSAYGKRACILDDGTAEGRERAALMAARASRAVALTVGGARNADVNGCIAAADAVFLATEHYALFCGSRVARRLSVGRLFARMLHRDFDLREIGSRFGAVYRAVGAPLPRTPEIERIERAYHERAKVAATDDALQAYAATQIAALAAAKTDRGSAAHTVRSMRFATILGDVAFDAYGDRVGAAIVLSKL